MSRVATLDEVILMTSTKNFDAMLVVPACVTKENSIEFIGAALGAPPKQNTKRLELIKFG